MASSVALMFAANLATIGGHLAEMISIFVNTVIGYFWTRRRRRSPLSDFDVVDPPTLSRETTNTICVLSEAVVELDAILENLEGVTKEAKKQKHFVALLQEHRSLEAAVSNLTCSLKQDSIDVEGTSRQEAWNLSRKVKLLKLEGDMISFESRRLRVYDFQDSLSTRALDSLDLEAGILQANRSTMASQALEDPSANSSITISESSGNSSAVPESQSRTSTGAFGNIEREVVELVPHANEDGPLKPTKGDKEMKLEYPYHRRFHRQRRMAPDLNFGITQND
ncbi:hypothetical protein VNI00_008513 [Paramarasmius palmivorus]|uniref:Fungal N-terminal domain-containing protein n=1 Tax=Paramarasmius palmivorus TaxID=297713 RepID=A0AAW0CX12_9AGAR